MIFGRATHFIFILGLHQCINYGNMEIIEFPDDVKDDDWITRLKEKQKTNHVEITTPEPNFISQLLATLNKDITTEKPKTEPEKEAEPAKNPLSWITDIMRPKPAKTANSTTTTTTTTSEKPKPMQDGISKTDGNTTTVAQKPNIIQDGLKMITNLLMPPKADSGTTSDTSKPTEGSLSNPPKTDDKSNTASASEKPNLIEDGLKMITNILTPPKADGGTTSDTSKPTQGSLINPPKTDDRSNTASASKKPNPIEDGLKMITNILTPPKADGGKTSDASGPPLDKLGGLISMFLNLLQPKSESDQNDPFTSLITTLMGATLSPGGALQPNQESDQTNPGLSLVKTLLSTVLSPKGSSNQESDQNNPVISMITDLLGTVLSPKESPPAATTNTTVKKPSTEPHLQLHRVKIPNVYVSRFNEYFSHEWTEATFGILGPVGLSGRLGGLAMMLTSGAFGTHSISGAGAETNLIGQILNTLTSGAFGGKGIIGDNPQIDLVLGLANTLTGGKIPKHFADV